LKKISLIEIPILFSLLEDGATSI